jgi:hypothetical protein
VAAAHEPSPRQNVVEPAPVPLFKFPTGRLPVTPFDKSTCAHAGMFDAPVFDKYRVAEALVASFDNVFAALA